MTVKRETLEKLARTSARRAGEGLASLFERKLIPEQPALVFTRADELAAHLPAAARVTAVLAELEGASVGRIGLLLSEPAGQDAVSSLVQRRRTRAGAVGLAFDLLATSAFLELGNIAFSAAANGLAETIAGRIFPSVPRASSDAAGDLARGWPSDGEALITEFDLVSDGEAMLRCHLAWLPDPGSWE